MGFFRLAYMPRLCLRLSTALGRRRRGAKCWQNALRRCAAFPRDLDVFLLMQAGFDREFAALPSPQREVFAHEAARLRFEADVFWATEAIGTEELLSWLSVYQLARELMPRGIVEVPWHD
jgi:hypothetical protein